MTPDQNDVNSLCSDAVDLYERITSMHHAKTQLLERMTAVEEGAEELLASVNRLEGIRDEQGGSENAGLET